MTHHEYFYDYACFIIQSDKSFVGHGKKKKKCTIKNKNKYLNLVKVPIYNF